jgi:hypothetical protein
MAKRPAAKATTRKTAVSALPPFLTLNGMAKALQLTPQRVCQLARDEIIGRADGRGLYASSCIGQYCQFIRARSQRSTTTQAAEEGQRIRNELNKAKLRLIEYEEKLRDGQLITIAERDTADAVLREHILARSGTLPEMLEGLDRDQMRLIIDDNSRQLLSELSEPDNPSLSETFFKLYAEIVEEREQHEKSGGSAGTVVQEATERGPASAAATVTK